MPTLQRRSRSPRWLALAAVMVAWLAGCAPDPAKPTDTALSCQQMTEEIAALEASGKLSESKASELRPGYYAVQAVEFVPYVGDALGMVDMFADVSNSRELDRLNANTEMTRARAAHLAKLRTARCGGVSAPAAPGGPTVPPDAAVPPSQPMLRPAG